MNADQIRTIFARNLCNLLQIKGKSQIEVAKELNIKKTTFSSWCTGAKFPRADKLDMLADYFHIEREDLIRDNAVSKIKVNHDTAQKLEKIIDIAEQLNEEEWEKLIDYALLLLSAKSNHKED